MRPPPKPLEVQAIVAGDRGFRGVNTRLHPGQLEPGYVAHAVNRRFDRGTIRNRWGIVRPQWGGISGAQQGWADLTAGSYSANLYFSRPPMPLASIAARGIPPSTLVATYSGDSITLDSTLVTLDDDTITLDSGPVATLRRGLPLASYDSELAYVAGYAQPFGGDPIGAGAFLDPDSGARVVLVAVDQARADGGQGRIWAIQPGYVPQEVPLNGHDVYGAVRFIQAFAGVLMLRPRKARYYVSGTAIDNLYLTLRVPPAFQDGTRVTWLQIGSAGSVTSLISGTNYWAHTHPGNRITLHSTLAEGVSGANPITLAPKTAAERYAIERNDSYEVIDDPDRNLGTPLLMQANPSQREALAAGFDRLVDTVRASSADPETDILLVANHRLVDGDPVAVTQSTIPGLLAGTYFAAVRDPHQIRLFTEQLEALAGSGASQVHVTDTGTAVLRKVGAASAPVPPGRLGVYFGNRAWLVYGRDMLLASGVMDPVHYQRISDQFRINAGTDDAIVSIAPFNEDTLVVFKQRSILALTGVYGDLSQMRLVEITRQFGCLAELSVASTGSDLVFLSQRGVATLRQTSEGLTQSVVDPLSDPIQSYLDMSDARLTGNACAAYHDNRYLLAIDRSSGGTAVLPYNFLNQAWEGIWEGSLLSPIQFLPVVVAGRTQLGWIDRSRFLHYFGGAFTDQTMDGRQLPIATSVLTRGYGGDDMGHKRWTLAEFDVASLNGTYSMVAQLDGVFERITMRASQTHDRTRYLTYGGGVYDVHNLLDGFAAPFRADYTLKPGFQCRSGVRTGLHQRYLHRHRLGRRNGATIQLELQTATGSVEILATLAEGIPHGVAGYIQH